MYSSISPPPPPPQSQSQSQSSPFFIPQALSFSCNDDISFTSMPMFHPYFTTTTSPTPKSTPDTKTPQQLNEPSSRKRKQISQKKDRNCKIVTAQGLRDRRVRLSIDIARQFFDLQDSLGFDTASKTLDWLLTKSRTAIKEVQTKKLPDEEENAEAFEDLNKNKTTFCTKERVVVQSSQLVEEKEERPKARILRTRETTTLMPPPPQPLNTEPPSSFRLLQPIKSCITCESELFCFCLLNGRGSSITQSDPRETFDNFGGVITKKLKPSTLLSDNLEFSTSCNTFFCPNNFINSSGDLQEMFRGIQR